MPACKNLTEHHIDKHLPRKFMPACKNLTEHHTNKHLPRKFMKLILNEAKTTELEDNLITQMLFSAY